MRAGWSRKSLITRSFYRQASIAESCLWLRAFRIALELRNFNKTYQERILCGSTFFFSDLCERPALFGKALQQRRGFPNFAMLPMEFHDALVYLFEPNGVCVPHRSASVAGKAVAIYIDDVNV